MRIGVDVYAGQVLEDWIDVNGHMNVAYYVLAFDYGVDTLWERIDMTDTRRSATGSSTFAVENHVTWQRELAADAAYRVTTQILAYDGKRIHQFMRMYDDADRLCATCEWMNLHVDLNVRRVSPWPDDVLEKIADFVRVQGAVDWPAEAGRRMRIKAPLFAVAH